MTLRRPPSSPQPLRSLIRDPRSGNEDSAQKENEGIRAQARVRQKPSPQKRLPRAPGAELSPSPSPGQRVESGIHPAPVRLSSFLRPSLTFRRLPTGAPGRCGRPRGGGAASAVTGSAATGSRGSNKLGPPGAPPAGPGAPPAGPTVPRAVPAHRRPRHAVWADSQAHGGGAGREHTKEAAPEGNKNLAQGSLERPAPAAPRAAPPDSPGDLGSSLPTPASVSPAKPRTRRRGLRPPGRRERARPAAPGRARAPARTAGRASELALAPRRGPAGGGARARAAAPRPLQAASRPNRASSRPRPAASPPQPGLPGAGLAQQAPPPTRRSAEAPSEAAEKPPARRRRLDSDPLPLRRPWLRPPRIPIGRRCRGLPVEEAYFQSYWIRKPSVTTLKRASFRPRPRSRAQASPFPRETRLAPLRPQGLSGVVVCGLTAALVSGFLALGATRPAACAEPDVSPGQRSAARIPGLSGPQLPRCW